MAKSKDRNKSTLYSEVVLASTSPYRRQLLERSGLRFRVQAPDINEKSIKSKNPRSLALKRAQAKAKAVSLACPYALVIGADQVLALGRRIYDKVSSANEAQEVIKSLSGKRHFLYSALSLYFNGKEVFGKVFLAPMRMRKLLPHEIHDYVLTNEWLGSVGCYKIEGKGIKLIEPPIADYFTIIGLPLAELFQALRRLGIYH